MIDKGVKASDDPEPFRFGDATGRGIRERIRIVIEA